MLGADFFFFLIFFFFKNYRLDRAAGVGDTLTAVLTSGRESWSGCVSRFYESAKSVCLLDLHTHCP